MWAPRSVERDLIEKGLGRRGLSKSHAEEGPGIHDSGRKDNTECRFMTRELVPVKGH